MLKIKRVNVFLSQIEEILQGIPGGVRRIPDRSEKKTKRVIDKRYG